MKNATGTMDPEACCAENTGHPCCTYNDCTDPDTMEVDPSKGCTCETFLGYLKFMEDTGLQEAGWAAMVEESCC